MLTGNFLGKMSGDNKISDDVFHRAKSTSRLAAGDRPSEKLMNTIAQHIIYDHLSTIAFDLVINKAKLSCITATSNINIQRFEVIL